MNRVISLAEYVSDGSFYGFRDEEAITSFLNLYRAVTGTEFKELHELIRRYMSDGHYDKFPFSVHRGDHTVRFQNQYGTLVYASDELLSQK